MTDSPITPGPTIPSGTTDITDLVDKMTSTFESWADTFLFELIASEPGMAWLRLPLISTIAKFIIDKAVSAIVGSGMFAVFVLNTALRKSGQANDYISAINAKNSLPPTATDAEYRRYEQAEMDAFYNFVRISN